MPEVPAISYHDQIQPHIGGRLAAVFVAGLVGPNADALLAWADLSQTRGVEILPLLHAIEMEEHYLDQVIDFADPPTPVYASGVLDLRALNLVFDLERLVCVVTLREDGVVHAARSYRDVEMGQLEELHDRIGSVSGSLFQHGMENRRGHCN